MHAIIWQIGWSSAIYGELQNTNTVTTHTVYFLYVGTTVYANISEMEMENNL